MAHHQHAVGFAGALNTSGHSDGCAQTIIEHYLGSTREFANAGIDKLIARMQREGIAM